MSNIREDDVRDFSNEQSDEPVDTVPQTTREEIYAQARELITIKAQKVTLDGREKMLKGSLMDALRQHGELDGNGHAYLELDPPIRSIGRLVRQRRVSSGVDAVVAEAVARDLGIYEDLFKPVYVLDEDAVLVARQRELLSDADMDRIFPKKVTYAFLTEKTGGKK